MRVACRVMTDTTIFTCDWCGNRDFEMPADAAPERSSVELVLRGGRLHPAVAARAVPEWDGAERWVAVLCDRCMKRFAALFDLSLTTPVEREVLLRAQAVSVAHKSMFGIDDTPDSMRVPEPVASHPNAEPAPMSGDILDRSRGVQVASHSNPEPSYPDPDLTSVPASVGGSTSKRVSRRRKASSSPTSK